MSDTLPKPSYPAWVCQSCAAVVGKFVGGLATWHTDTCDLCRRTTSVTEPRDYGHLTLREIETIRGARAREIGDGGTVAVIHADDMDGEGDA